MIVQETHEQASLQLGFDLDLPSAPQLEWGPLPWGSWNTNISSRRVRTERVQRARAALSQVRQHELCGLYDQGIAIAEAALAERNGHSRVLSDDPIYWSIVDLKLTAVDAEHMIRLFDGARNDGLEFKCRRTWDRVKAGIYMDPVGTLLLMQSTGGSAWMLYYPERDSFFMASYHDTAAHYEVSAQLWEHCNLGSKIALTDKPPSVKTFDFEGQRYTIVGSGGRAGMGRLDGKGWKVIPKQQWQGQVFSYWQLCGMWEDGSLERGDQRGHLVSVRGQLHVMSEMATFSDSNYVHRARPVKEPAVEDANQEMFVDPELDLGENSDDDDEESIELED